MESKWKEVPLGQLYEFRSGISKPRSQFGFGYGFLSFKDVFYNIFVPEKLIELVNSTERERESCSIKRGDVFLTRTSETMEDLGMSCVALKNYESATFNGFTKRLRPKANVKTVPEYAGYFFRSPRFRLEVTAMSSLSTRASLNNEMLGKLKMVLPSPEEQSAIGFILRGFDDKIENNSRMNETLESIARAIFKSWFVDFDPVSAKADGHQPVGMDTDTAALFPNSFEDSPMGKIPKGWAVKALDEVIEINPQRQLQKGESAPFLEMKYMPTRGHRPLSWMERPFSSGTRFINGDTLVARITPCLENGKTAFVDFLPDGQTGWGSTEYIVLRPKPSLSPVYGYFLARSEDFRAFAIQSMTGTSGRQRVQTSSLKRFVIVAPPQGVAKEFSRLADPIMQLVRANDMQTGTLSFLRDTLIPKLVSGEVRVKDAEKFVEEHAS